MTAKAPHITANALVRYCFARAPERSRIIRDFRDNDFPPFKGWYGGETEGAIRSFISSGGRDMEPLDSLEELLIRREARTDHEEDKIQGQLHALEAIRNVDLGMLVKHGNPDSVKDGLGPFFVSGVRVSIRPTNILKSEKYGQKELAVGAIKPYFASTEPLLGESGLLYAAMLHWYVEEMMKHIGVADRRLTFVVDVFSGNIFQAPAAYKQRRDLLEHSCQEIYERWYSGSSTISTKAASRRGV